MAASVELKRYLETAQKYITSAETLIKSDTPDPEQVKFHLSLFERYLPKIEKFRPSKKDKDEVGFGENAVPILDDIFITQLQLEQLESKLNPKPEKPVVTEQLPLFIQPHASIPQLKLQAFDGSKRQQYRRFRETFKSIFDSAPMNDKQRFLRLQSYITGDAEQYVSTLPIEDESYQAAWLSLDHEYDDPSTLIAELYGNIHSLKPSSTDTTQLRKTFNTIEVSLKALERYGERINDNIYLRNVILQKFPVDIIFSLSKKTELTIQAFRLKMDQNIRVRESYSTITTVAPLPTTSSSTSDTKAKSNVTSEMKVHASSNTSDSTVASTSGNSQKHLSCAFCKEMHYSDACSTYTNHEARKARISGQCYNCLNKHEPGKCPRMKKCFHCRQEHHSSLCPTKFPKPSDENPTTEFQVKKPPSQNSDKTPVRNLLVSKFGTYMTACTRIRNPTTGTSKYVRIIFDGGCPRSLITDNIADALQLKKSDPREVPVKGFLDQHPKKLQTSTVEFEFAEIRRRISAQTTPEIATDVYAIDHNEFLKKYPQYNNINFADEGNEMTPAILIGGDYLFTFIGDEPKITVDEDLHIISSLIGSMISGKTDHETPMSYLITTISAMEQLTSLDTVGIRDAYLTQAEEEEQALKQFYKKIELTNNRYQVGWPWRMDPEILPGNYGISIGRLRSLYKNLQNKPDLLQAYDQIFKKQISDGILELSDSNHESGSYIPHHGVYQPEKSTPIRIVFAGNAKQSQNAISINEAIYKGRQLIEDLLSILLRFRKHPIALTSDLEKAYHQIGLRKEDRNYVKCIWLKDPTKPPEPNNLMHLQFTRIAFGIIASSFILQATIRYHLEKHAKEYPALIYDFYADNLVTGAQSVEDATQIADVAIKAFEKCSMNLRQWYSSSERVNQTIPEAKRANGNPATVLGLKWDTHMDCISLATPKFIEMEPTVRIILKNISRVYDPLGISAPVILKAKIFLHSLREYKLTYDEKLPHDFPMIWKENLDDLCQLKNLNLTRFVQITANTEFHCFADASKSGYGFVIYARDPSTHKTQFIFAKARVAPARALSIPKLELLAATLGARSLRFVTKALQQKENPATLWSDSKCTLARIHTTKILSTYEENRVREIRASKITCRYVPSELNVADAASRGQSFANFAESPWFTGPEFLQFAEETWPKYEPVDFENFDMKYEEEQEESTSEVFIALPLQIAKPKDIWSALLDRCSTFRKLINATAYVFRFITTKVHRTVSIFKVVNENFYYAALIFWIKRIQQEHFHGVFQDLQSKKKNILIDGLRIQIDSEGLLRSHGRMKFAQLSEEERTPIMLPKTKESKFVQLLVLHYHELNFHTGTTHTLTAIRRRYWPLQGRRSVYNIIRKCSRCTPFTARPFQQPEEPDLPNFRLEPKKLPFSTVGIDTIGSFTVDKSEKHILLVVCLITRAVTLEALNSLETKELSFALRRFKARRTSPDLYYSDNAPQFTLLEQLSKENSEKAVVWKKIPSGASWMGGAYERLVPNVKNAIYRTFNHRTLTVEQFRTVLLEIEATINSRPITYHGTEDDPIPLTPNDFLQMRFETTDVDFSPTTDHDISRKTLLAISRQGQAILNTFWKLWATTYLQELRQRHQWNQRRTTKRSTTETPVVGDVVILHDAVRKRNTWPIAVIKSLISSEDGEIRSAEVKVSSGVQFVRSIAHLYPLGFNENNIETPNEETPAAEFDELDTVECEVFEE